MQITKEIDLGNGCKITVASLTFDQIEDQLGEGIPESRKAQRAVSWREIVQAVNNVPGQESWDRRAIVDKLEAAFPALVAVRKFNELRDHVMEITGYIDVKKNEAEADPNPTPENQ